MRPVYVLFPSTSTDVDDVFGGTVPMARTPSEPELLLSRFEFHSQHWRRITDILASPPNLDHIAEFNDPLTPTRSGLHLDPLVVVS
jgi:hypothetical protein